MTIRFLLIAAVAAAALSAEARPRRILSLNLCADQLVATLADPDDIVALTELARDPGLSAVADRAATSPTTRGDAEDALRLAPDLVVAGPYGARPAVALLRERGAPILELGLADDFDAIRAQIRDVAAALGRPERGEAEIAAMDAALARAAAVPTGSRRPTALLYGPNGFVAGAGSLTDSALAAAGFANYAAEAGIVGYGVIPLERLVAAPPDYLILDDGPDARPSMAETLLRHPALARLPSRRIASPGAALACGAPATAQAVLSLAEARAAAEARR